MCFMCLCVCVCVIVWDRLVIVYLDVCSNTISEFYDSSAGSTYGRMLKVNDTITHKKKKEWKIITFSSM